MANFLEGKKSYIVAILGAVAAVATAFGYSIPEWVWPLLAAAGLGAVRQALPSPAPDA